MVLLLRTAFTLVVGAAMGYVVCNCLGWTQALGSQSLLQTNNGIRSDTNDASSGVAGNYASEHVDSNDAQNSDRHRVSNIRLIGERHSGTTFVHNFLGSCFPVRMSSGPELNFKHWYQPTPEYILDLMQREEANTTYETGPFRGYESTLHSWKDIAYNISAGDPSTAREKVLRDTHVIMMVRDPYDWMESMRTGPYHWPYHTGTFRQYPDEKREKWGRWEHEPLKWKEFVDKPLKFEEDTATDANQDVVCQKGYLSGVVQPCVSQMGSYIPRGFNNDTVPPPGVLPWSARDPIYEMQPETHEPFPNPLALREYKLQMMLDIQKHWRVGGFRVVRYEDLSKMYLTDLVRTLSELLGEEPKCDVAATSVRLTAKKDITPDFEKWITTMANWTTEGLVGYSPSVV